MCVCVFVLFIHACECVRGCVGLRLLVVSMVVCMDVCVWHVRVRVVYYASVCIHVSECMCTVTCVHTRCHSHLDYVIRDSVMYNALVIIVYCLISNYDSPQVQTNCLARLQGMN
jgi:hypothetical protein